MTRDRRLGHPRGVHRHHHAFDHAHRSVLSEHYNEEAFLPREDFEKSTVFDLVYKYLSKCADKNMKSKQRNCACNKFNKRHARKKDIHGHDVATIRTNLKGIFDDDDERSRSRADKNGLSKRVSRSSSRKYVADYAKAVREGRRRAKFYVRKALLYGLQSGLLIPTDRRRNVLRVSQELGTLLSRNAREDDEDRSSITTSDTERSVRDRRLDRNKFNR